MSNWYHYTQIIIEEIDACIISQKDYNLSLTLFAKRLGFSPYYLSKKFKEITGLSLRDYLRFRRISLASKEIRETQDEIVNIAFKYGFSSHEAFSRAFKKAFGLTPSNYRNNPVPLSLRTIIHPFDCYLAQQEGEKMSITTQDIKIYFITIPKHKFLHIRNYQSIGYWDFWQKQSLIPGQDCDTICGLLDSIKGKLDDLGGHNSDSGAGQLMAFINDPAGRICRWGIPLAEAYGARLPIDYQGEIPSQMQLMDVGEGEYIVFEHGPFDFANENAAVEAKIEKAMQEFDFPGHGYQLDLTPGRVFYFYHDCTRYWKYVRPVKKII